VKRVEYSLDFESEPGMLIVTVSGLASLEQLLAYQAEYLFDPRWSPGMNVLTDLRGLDASTLSSDQIRAFAASNNLRADLFGSGRTAVVVSERVTFGLLRMFQFHTDAAGFDQRAFYSLEEARRWLAETPG
jgi:hypothetical protein